MQRTEHQVPGLGSGHRHADGLGIAHFTDEDDVRIFAHRGTNAIGESGYVGMEFALHYLGLLAAVDELDGVFKGNDVHPARTVQVIDHRGEGGALARTRGASDENHALVIVQQAGDYRWQTKVCE